MNINSQLVGNFISPKLPVNSNGIIMKMAFFKYNQSTLAMREWSVRLEKNNK